MVLQNRSGMGGLFLNFTLTNTHQIAPTRLFLQKYTLLKKIVKGRSLIKSFYIIFFKLS